MKLNVGRTLLLGFGFFGVSISVGNPRFVRPCFPRQGFRANASVVGTILTVNTIIVFLIQPSIGSLSDRTRTRIGRRMPFIVIFAPLAAIGFAILPMLVQPTLLWVFVGASDSDRSSRWRCSARRSSR